MVHKDARPMSAHAYLLIPLLSIAIHSFANNIILGLAVYHHTVWGHHSSTPSRSLLNVAYSYSTVPPVSQCAIPFSAGLFVIKLIITHRSCAQPAPSTSSSCTLGLPPAAFNRTTALRRSRTTPPAGCCGHPVRG